MVLAITFAPVVAGGCPYPALVVVAALVVTYTVMVALEMGLLPPFKTPSITMGPVPIVASAGAIAPTPQPLSSKTPRAAQGTAKQAVRREKCMGNLLSIGWEGQVMTSQTPLSLTAESGELVHLESDQP